MGEQFNYAIQSVPDIDQRWQILPNGGAQFCVPACALNWIHYFANHGHPSAAPFPFNNFGIPIELLLMSWQMGTDPQSGTSFDDGVEGQLEWMDAVGLPALIFASSVSEDEDDIPFATYKSLVSFGAFVNVRLGRYKKSGSEFVRTSGHCLTMTGLKRSDDLYSFSFHDPGRPTSDTTTQSAAKETSRDLHPWTANLEGEVVSVMRFGMTTNPYRFLDGYSAVLPAFALTNSSSLVLHSARLDGPGVKTKRFGTPFKQTIIDLALDPVSVVAAAVTENGDVWKLDLADGTWTKLAHVDRAIRIAFGAASRLYVATATDGRVVCLDRTGKPIARAATRSPIADIAYDVRERRLLALSQDVRTLTAFSHRLKRLGSTEAIAPAGKGRIKLTVDGRDSTLIIAREGSPGVATMRWHPSRVTSRALLELKASVKGSPRRRGDRLVPLVVDGRLTMFSRDGVRVSGHPLDRRRVGPLVEIATSACNDDRTRSQLPRWRDG